MKKKISRGCAVLLACAMLAGLLMTTAFARASDYLAIYSVWATAKSDGVVRIHADVEAVRTSDEVGVSYITVQESDDGGKTWTTLKKIYEGRAGDVRAGYSGILRDLRF